MELWLCPRNKFALLKTETEVTVFAVDDPDFCVMELTASATHTVQDGVEAFIKKNNAVKALISGHDIPDDANHVISIRDFDEIYQVNVLTKVGGHKKYVTFMAFVNNECAYLQFYVDKKGKARCMARTSIQHRDKWGVRVSSSTPAFLIFNH